MAALPKNLRTRGRAMVFLGVCILSTACATKPVLYQDLPSSAHLRSTSARVDDERVAFNTDLKPGDLNAYASIIMEPARIYRGRDGQFGNLSEQSRAELARHADHHFNRELARRHLLVALASKGSLRMRVTITGAQGSIPVIATATKLTPVGLALSGLRFIRDKEGNFSGAVMYAVELFDAGTGKLVYAFVTRQYPNALNIPATILPLGAAKAGIERGASTAAAALKALMAPEHRSSRG